MASSRNWSVMVGLTKLLEWLMLAKMARTGRPKKCVMSHGLHPRHVVSARRRRMEDGHR